MITIYLIRHGQTPGNLQRRYVGRTDEPLCSTAIEQICAQGELYRKAFSTTGGGKTLETIYVSPMLRCKQTAHATRPLLTVVDRRTFLRLRHRVIFEQESRERSDIVWLNYWSVTSRLVYL